MIKLSELKDDIAQGIADEVEPCMFVSPNAEELADVSLDIIRPHWDELQAGKKEWFDIAAIQVKFMQKQQAKIDRAVEALEYYAEVENASGLAAQQALKELRGEE